jgi:acetyl esterase/lipase
VRIETRLLIGLFGLTLAASAQHQVIPVWPDVPPGSENWTQQEETFSGPPFGDTVRNVTKPALTAYFAPAATANGTAIIVCPGGAFQFLSWASEGTQVAEWLNAHGITAFVLKYRLQDTGPTREDFQKKVMALLADLMQHRNDRLAALDKISVLAEADGRQAVKVVRQHAAEWGIAPDRIGIMGFSAGAEVTMGDAMIHDAESRANFTAPIYGPGLLENVAVPADAAPMFILCASDDPLLPATLSSHLYDAWKTAGKSAELHIFAKGGHGFGMKTQHLPVDRWIELFGGWLEVQGFMKPAH